MKIIGALVALALAAPVLHAQDDQTIDPWDSDAPQAASAAANDPVLEETQRRYPFRRSLMRDDLEIRIKKMRLESGKRVSLVYGAPKNARSCPAVFVMDVEASSLAHQPSYPFARLSKQKRDELRHAGYLTRSPFGSNLLGNGFAVAYVMAEDFETLRSARTADWVAILDRVRNLKEVEDDSFFLFSTREYANLSLYLAANYSFAGLILEEPTYLLFSRNPYDNVVAKSRSLTPEEIWTSSDPSRQQRYLSIFSQITAPIMLIRDRSSTAYVFNEKTLIPTLRQAHAYVESVNLPGPTRALETFGASQGALDVAPNVSYHPRHVSIWLNQMISYLKANSNAEAVALRDPANYRNW